MALASQSARTRTLSARAGYTGSLSRRRARRNRRALAVVAGIGLVIVLFWMVRGGDNKDAGSTDVAGDVSSTMAGSPDQTPALIGLVTGRDKDRNDAGSTPGATPAQRTPDRPPTLTTGERASTPTLENATPPGQDPGASARNGGGQPVIVEPLNQPADPAADPATPRAGGSAPVKPLSSDIEARLEQATLLTTEQRLVQARTVLNDLLQDPRLASPDRQGIRQWLTDINNTLLFSPKVFADDPLQSTYQVKSGDYLSTIVKREKLKIDYRLLARINGVRPERIRVGQALKVLHGPFHAVVDKSDYRLDIYAGPTPEAPRAGEKYDTEDKAVRPGWVYVRSFKVGLGEYGLTPTGTFRINGDSRLVNPGWTNPRTNERFGPDDPRNPIGDRWLGLVGLDDATRSTSGMGVHGTIDPDSIGQERSMGCVRLLADDIEFVYELLAGSDSYVYIVE